MARPQVFDDPDYRREGGSVGRALRNRLERGRPTPEDEAMLAKSKLIRDRRRQGWTWPKVAAELGEPKWQTVARFAAKGRYHTCCLWLARLEQGDVPRAAQAPTVPTVGTSPKEHRGLLARMVPAALRRLELSLAQGVLAGDDGREQLRESKAADHAMDTVLAATGLLEPEGGSVRPTIHIETLVINTLARDIVTDDEKIRRAIEVEAVAS